MQVNEGKFLQNGKCGYILKPSYMLKNSDYNPTFHCSLMDEEPVIVIVQVIFYLIKCLNFVTKYQSTFLQIIAARHLTKSKRGIVSPCVEVEIIGSQQDTINNKHTTKIISKRTVHKLM